MTLNSNVKPKISELLGTVGEFKGHEEMKKSFPGWWSANLLNAKGKKADTGTNIVQQLQELRDKRTAERCKWFEMAFAVMKRTGHTRERLLTGRIKV